MSAPRAAALWLLLGTLCAPALSLPTVAHARPQRTLIIESITVSGVRMGRRRAMVARTGLAQGDLVDEAEIDEARARLIETGLFTQVNPRLIRGSAPGRVGVHFECVERNTTSIDAVHLGHARPTPIWAGLDVSDIDPFGRGFSLGGGVVSSGAQTAARLSLGRPRAFGQGVGLTVRARFASGREPFVGPKGQQLDGAPVDQIFVPYRRLSLGGTVRVDLDPQTQLATGLRVELAEAELPSGAQQIAADRSVQPFDFGIGEGQGVMPVAGLGLSHDTRDDPSAPRRGSRTAFSLRGGYFDDPFLIFLGSVERYLPLPRGQVLRFDVRGGGVVGDAPFFERFFIGDLHPYVPERALGLNFARRRGPLLLDQGLGEQRYENFAARAGVEWRVPLGDPTATYRAELFLGGAILTLGSPGEIADPQGPTLPMDIAFDAGLRISTEFGVMGLSVGNLFLLVDP